MAPALLLGACASDSDSASSSEDTIIQDGGLNTGFVNRQDAAEPKQGGTLTMGMYAPVQSLDPVKINGSGTAGGIEMAALYDVLVRYDYEKKDWFPHLAQSVEPNADFTQWTARIRPGIRFQDDPAFGGKPRELTAADYAYSIKRFADPKVASPVWTTVESWKLSGLAAAREAALKAKRDFDYDAPIAGLQVLDRYTLRFQLDRPHPRFLQEIALSDLFGAVAREVIEAAGDTLARAGELT